MANYAAFHQLDKVIQLSGMYSRKHTLKPLLLLVAALRPHPLTPPHAKYIPTSTSPQVHPEHQAALY